MGDGNFMYFCVWIGKDDVIDGEFMDIDVDIDIEFGKKLMYLFFGWIKYWGLFVDLLSFCVSFNSGDEYGRDWRCSCVIGVVS